MKVCKFCYMIIDDIFLDSAPNIDCRCLFELPQEGVPTRTSNLCFRAKIKKIASTTVNSTFPYVMWDFQGTRYSFHRLVTCFVYMDFTSIILKIIRDSPLSQSLHLDKYSLTYPYALICTEI